MKNLCIKTIETGKGKMMINLCKIIGKCENKDCRCVKARRLNKQNEEIYLEA
ncbi:MAG: hypothetical protein AABX33_02030 [Nanoarchaeota archaeon]